MRDSGIQWDHLWEPCLLVTFFVCLELASYERLITHQSWISWSRPCRHPFANLIIFIDIYHVHATAKHVKLSTPRRHCQRIGIEETLRKLRSHVMFFISEFTENDNSRLPASCLGTRERTLAAPLRSSPFVTNNDVTGNTTTSSRV